jgi:hypothetical protein
VNANIVRGKLQAGLICGVNCALMKLFTLGFVQTKNDPLPALFNHAALQ